MNENKNIQISKIIKRLELIKSLIALEEEEEIVAHTSKLKELLLQEELEIIIIFLKDKFYSKAVTAIDIFINQHHRLAIYNDPEIIALKLEIKSLEIDINSLSAEIADLEKLIYEFGNRHNKELGELIVKILAIRRKRAKGTPDEKETEDDFKAYNGVFQSTKDEHIATLGKQELTELKERYRKASKLCHPDVVSEVQKELASKIFAELSIAYEKNDLKRVREILQNLEQGNFFISKSNTINEKRILQSDMEKSRMRIVELKQKLSTIKQSNTCTTINIIENWDVYFKIAKEKLQSQLRELEDGK